MEKSKKLSTDEALKEVETLGSVVSLMAISDVIELLKRIEEPACESNDEFIEEFKDQLEYVFDRKGTELLSNPEFEIEQQWGNNTFEIRLSECEFDSHQISDSIDQALEAIQDNKKAAKERELEAASKKLQEEAEAEVFETLESETSVLNGNFTPEKE
jgi:hypothetical protein|tara:strand:- start:1030 stop:1503 length:474 start_codon:yes stop_codon:yes gene_type:complete